ncbi:MAG: potassium transporter TrkH [Myxococcota bacterium]
MGSLAPWGFYTLQGDELLCQIPDDPFAAESVLRIAYHVATVRAGGLLVHASAIAFDKCAVAAVGPSGAGKSTLANLCASAEGKGKLLTDEIVQLFPEGLCAGTPFRSNHENVGSPGLYRLTSLLLLEKGSQERIDPVASHRGMPALLSQVFRSEALELSNAEVLRRLADTVEASGLHRLTFRNDAAVGPFLRQWVATCGS